MSDILTPRTDAILKKLLQEHGYVGTKNCPQIWVEHARQLERELAEAIAERDDVLMILGIYTLGCDEQKRELTNLRARLESDAAIGDWKRKNGKT